MIAFDYLLKCSTELMSANLEAMTLGKQGTLKTFTLNYFARPPPKAGKTGHTIFFTNEKKNRMTNEIASQDPNTIKVKPH